ncbi:MAG: hypothetical protein HQL03_11185 [Nitrospirae bacterium]|nr:hypothetical protein [Nitrospirota bacterium]
MFYGEGIYSATFYIAARQEFVQSNPEIVEGVLSALYRAEQYINKEPAISQEIIAESCNLNMVLVQELWGLYNSELTLDQSLVSSLENETQWAIEGGKVNNTEVPDYLDYVYVNGLKKIKPHAITIIE